MANKKISELSATTESNDNVFLVMNNSGNTETFRIKREDLLSGTTTPPGLVSGTGTNSIESADYLTSVPAIASGLNSIAIGQKAKATGDDSVVIGDINGDQAGTRSIIIGKHFQLAGANGQTIIGSGCFTNGVNAIAIGHETAVSANAIVLGGNTSRANASFAITLGNQNERNQSEYTYILGTNNRNATAPDFRGSPFSVIIGTEHTTEVGLGFGRNNIIGGTNNTITGNTSGTTLIGLINFTSPTENDTTYTQNHASLGQSYQGYFDNGSGSTFTIDWNSGNTQKMSWNASGGTITCSNTQTGAHYRMVINNPSGHAPASFSVSGKTIKFNGGSFVVYSGESVCELFITDDSVFVNQLGLFS